MRVSLSFARVEAAAFEVTKALADLRTDGANEVRDEQQSTETVSCGLRAKGEGRTRRRRAGGAARRPVYREQPSFRCCCERCRLARVS